MKRKDREVIEKSFSQMANIAWADHVVCKSELNLEVLRNAGVRTPATVLPLAIHAPAPPPESKPSFTDHVIRMAFVGRFVKPKGPEELLAALKQVRLPHAHGMLRIDFVGNTAFSDPEVLRNVRDGIAALNDDAAARITAEIHGDADDATKNAILRNADVFVLPTYHEGFGVPIVEAIAAGCHVVAYDNSNTPSVAGGLATLVPTGDVVALRDALSGVLAKVAATEWRSGPQGYSAYVARARAHAGKFAPEKVARDFVELVTRLAS
ncbi:glycosyltransferase [Burkholderia cenocepacia]|uniref:glycosyltransferase n=1 Tax=Burkholderia cenocepacia TaxID=95486 RepID=UPI002AB6B655|nr:glycosyltransferase [Burkholderia cenocepacia]